MNELDENGWGNIHQAAFRGFVKSVERFVKADPESLELETNDDLKSTPFLLAVMSGSKDTVECLITLGARIHAVNSQNHGAIELCAFKQYIDMLEYFIQLNHERLPVWKNLIRFMSSDTDEEAEAAAKCIQTLTNMKDGKTSKHNETAFDNGIVPAISKVMKSTIGEKAKTAVLFVLLNLMHDEKVKEQAMSVGVMPSLVKHLKSQEDLLTQLSAKCIKELSVVKSNADQAVQNGVIPAIIKCLQTVKDSPTLVQVCEAVGTVCNANLAHQSAFGTTPGAVKAMVNLYEDLVDKPLQLAVTYNLAKIVDENVEIQNAFINEGVASRIIPLIRIESHKHNDLKMAGVEAINKLAYKNEYTQKKILEAGIVSPLLNMLKRSRQTETQEKIAGALWSLAGDDTEERRQMAEAIGVQTLNEFLSQQSEELHYIGSEAIGVLAQGPDSKVDEIHRNNGVANSVRLLRSDKEHIVLSIIRTLRYLAVRVGYMPHFDSQQTIAQTRGIKFLVALMVHSRNELIQVEAAYTLGCVALGNKHNLEEIHQNLDFSYVRILKMMYSPDPMVRLLSGGALAAFAYNNIQNQKDISEQGGVLFRCFQPFLESNDEFYRGNAAFQVVVLSKIIPDQEQAISSAAGIKLLVDLLKDSKSDIIRAMTCDFIARLAHTRAGVPAAFVSIDCVNFLCGMMESLTTQVQGNAAIALSYLSYDHKACRQLLNRCRQDPHLMVILKRYTTYAKVNPEFLEGWKHYKQIGLPPIEEGKQFLISQQFLNGNHHFASSEDAGRPSTNSELGGSGSLTQPLVTDRERGSIMGSRASQPSPRDPDMRSREQSIISGRSRQNSNVSQNELSAQIAAK